MIKPQIVSYHSVRQTLRGHPDTMCCGEICCTRSARHRVLPGYLITLDRYTRTSPGMRGYQIGSCAGMGIVVQGTPSTVGLFVVRQYPADSVLLYDSSNTRT